MFGIKMPWTRRKERLAKEAAEKLAAAVIAAMEEKATLDKRQKWRDDVAAANRDARTRQLADMPRAPKVVTQTRTAELRHPYSPSTVNTDNHDSLTPTLITLAILSNMGSSVPAASSYCAPDSGASSYTPSYSSSSYESSCNSSSYDSGSSSSYDSSSSSSSSFD